MYCQISLANDSFTTICDVKHKMKPRSISHILYTKQISFYECGSFDYIVQTFHLSNLCLSSVCAKNMVIDRGQRICLNTCIRSKWRRRVMIVNVVHILFIFTFVVKLILFEWPTSGTSLNRWQLINAKAFIIFMGFHTTTYHIISFIHGREKFCKNIH